MVKSSVDINESLAFAKKLLKNKNFEKAEKLYKKILREFPNNFDANYFLASIKAQKNNNLDSKFYMEKALSVNPNLPELNNNLGLIYLNLNETEKSISFFKKQLN